MYRGCVTFTAHLLNKLKTNHVFISSSSNAFEYIVKDFGYGINYHLVPSQFIDKVKNPFITDMFQNFELLKKLRRTDITIVIHDHSEISKENEPYLKDWNIIIIRKTIQDFLKNKYDIDSKFLCHHFYPYPYRMKSMIIIRILIVTTTTMTKNRSGLNIQN